jgi:hypothetical protein
MRWMAWVVPPPGERERIAEAAIACHHARLV